MTWLPYLDEKFFWVSSTLSCSLNNKMCHLFFFSLFSFFYSQFPGPSIIAHFPSPSLLISFLPIATPILALPPVPLHSSHTLSYPTSTLHCQSFSASHFIHIQPPSIYAVPFQGAYVHGRKPVAFSFSSTSRRENLRHYIGSKPSLQQCPVHQVPQKKMATISLNVLQPTELF